MSSSATSPNATVISMEGADSTVLRAAAHSPGAADAHEMSTFNRELQDYNTNAILDVFSSKSIEYEKCLP